MLTYDLETTQDIVPGGDHRSFGDDYQTEITDLFASIERESPAHFALRALEETLVEIREHNRRLRAIVESM